MAKSYSSIEGTKHSSTPVELSFGKDLKLWKWDWQIGGGFLPRSGTLASAVF